MKITVVIPSHNHCRYVAQAIHSVMQQSYGDVELIVIDDGSSDGSRETIAELHRQYSEGFHFLARENRGLVATLRQGLELAQGEYFCELASDDYLHADNLRRRAAYLDQNPACVAVFTDGLNVETDGTIIGPITREKIKQLYRSDNPIPAIIGNTTPVFATGLMRRRALRECGGFDSDTFRFYEDIDTPVRLAALGGFGYIDEFLFYRRIHSSNVSSVTTHIRREKIFFYKKMLGCPGMEPYRRLLLRHMRRGGLALARTLAKADQIDELDYRVFTETLKKFPFDPRLRWYGLLMKQKWGLNSYRQRKTIEQVNR